MIGNHAVITSRIANWKFTWNFWSDLLFYNAALFCLLLGFWPPFRDSFASLAVCWFMASFGISATGPQSLWFVINMSPLRPIRIDRLGDSNQRLSGWFGLRLSFWALLTLDGNGRCPRRASCRPEAASERTTSAWDGKWLLPNALLSICSSFVFCFGFGLD